MGRALARLPADRPREHVTTACSGASVPGMATSEGFASSPLFDSLVRLRAAWPGGGWSWDGRLSCVSSSFSVELADEARAAAKRALPNEWTTQDISSAPADISEIAEMSGGVRADQVVLSTEPTAHVIAFGLWWPWGDDLTISLRVGLTGRISEDDQESFRDLFGATL